MGWAYSTCLCSFFFLMVPRPPCPTLFPYTTLFRSYRQVRPREGAVPLGPRRREEQGREQLVLGPRVTAVGRKSLGRHRDRKSTRLNSSHSQISYAVFCLKKKMEARHRCPCRVLSPG